MTCDGDRQIQELFVQLLNLLNRQSLDLVVKLSSPWASSCQIVKPSPDLQNAVGGFAQPLCLILHDVLQTTGPTLGAEVHMCPQDRCVQLRGLLQARLAIWKHMSPAWHAMLCWIMS